MELEERKIVNLSDIPKGIKQKLILNLTNPSGILKGYYVPYRIDVINDLTFSGWMVENTNVKHGEKILLYDKG